MAFFTRVDGAPMRFVMARSPHRLAVTRIVDKHGGILTPFENLADDTEESENDNDDDHVLLLVDPRHPGIVDVDYGTDVFHYKYVVHCHEKGELLDNLAEYKVNSSSVYEEIYDPVDLMTGRKTWKELKKRKMDDESCKSGEKEGDKEGGAVDVERIELDDEDMELDFVVNTRGSKRPSSTSSTVKKSSNLKRGRAPFTKREQLDVLKYIIVNRVYNEIGGTQMWKRMERRLSRNSRTWASLKENFRRQIMPSIGAFGLSRKHERIFRKVAKKFVVTIAEIEQADRDDDSGLFTSQEESERSVTRTKKVVVVIQDNDQSTVESSEAVGICSSSKRGSDANEDGEERNGSEGLSETHNRVRLEQQRGRDSEVESSRSRNPCNANEGGSKTKEASTTGATVRPTLTYETSSSSSSCEMETEVTEQRPTTSKRTRAPESPKETEQEQQAEISSNESMEVETAESNRQKTQVAYLRNTKTPIRNTRRSGERGRIQLRSSARLRASINKNQKELPPLERHCRSKISSNVAVIPPSKPERRSKRRLFTNRFVSNDSFQAMSTLSPNTKVITMRRSATKTGSKGTMPSDPLASSSSRSSSSSRKSSLSRASSKRSSSNILQSSSSENEDGSRNEDESNVDDVTENNEGRSESDDTNDEAEVPRLLSNGRLAYSSREDRILISYIRDNGLRNLVKGNAVWQQLEKQKILPNRTWQSMKNRFLKTLSSKYKIRPEDRKETKGDTLREVYDQRIPFTKEEDEAILRFLLENNRLDDIAGVALWQLMEVRGIGHNRSYHSLKNRFLRTIVNKLRDYNLDTIDRRRIRDAIDK